MNFSLALTTALAIFGSLNEMYLSCISDCTPVHTVLNYFLNNTFDWHFDNSSGHGQFLFLRLAAVLTSDIVLLF